MKNQIRRFVTSLGLTAVLGAPFLYSESMPTESATVPFAFHIQQRDLPAGRYMLTRVGSTGGVVLIKNMATGNSIVFTVNQGFAAQAGAADPKLVFNRYGDRYFLSQVWTPDATRIDVIKSALEKETAKGAGLVAMTVVPADR